MILTNRELFLLVVCTVFYITLFILVLQSHRRKILLLQSRLDNIHAMQKLAVIEPGRGDVNDIFYAPAHPYTKGLLRSMPRVDELVHERLIPIGGTPVDLLDPPPGCVFAPRCENCMHICLHKAPPTLTVGENGHISACWLHVKDMKGGAAE